MPMGFTPLKKKVVRRLTVRKGEQSRANTADRVAGRRIDGVDGREIEAVAGVGRPAVDRPCDNLRNEILAKAKKVP
jgi:hypothetical protein